MGFKKKIGAVLALLKERKESLVTKRLCGVNLKTLPGTIRSKTDMDDAWFFQLAKHNNVIYDIGSNIGYTALLALIQNPDRPYLLVDPNPKALQKASVNLLTNHLGFKANYYSAFVSDKMNDTVKFYTIGSGAAGSMYTSHAHSAAAVNSFSEVTTVTLDYLYDYYKIKPQLIKIDVEGAELLVMKGAKQVASETKCIFMIEMHQIETLIMEEMGSQMVAWCHEMDYTCWYMKTQEAMKDGTPISSRGKCHLLLTPKGTDYPNYLREIQQGAPLPNSL